MMNPWRSRQPAHKQFQAMRKTAHSFRKSTAQRRPRSPQKIRIPCFFFPMVTGKPRLKPTCGKRVRTIHERRFAVLATLTANTNLVKVIFRRGRKMKTVPELRAMLEVDPTGLLG